MLGVVPKEYKCCAGSETGAPTFAEISEGVESDSPIGINGVYGIESTAIQPFQGWGFLQPGTQRSSFLATLG